MNSDAIRLVALLAHDDIRAAVHENTLHELVENTVRSIRNDITAAVQEFLKADKPKATRRDG